MNPSSITWTLAGWVTNIVGLQGLCIPISLFPSDAPPYPPLFFLTNSPKISNFCHVWVKCSTIFHQAYNYYYFTVLSIEKACTLSMIASRMTFAKQRTIKNFPQSSFLYRVPVDFSADNFRWLIKVCPGLEDRD